MKKDEFNKNLNAFHHRWDEIKNKFNPPLDKSNVQTALNFIKFTNEVKMLLRTLNIDFVIENAELIAKLNQLDDQIDGMWNKIARYSMTEDYKKAIKEPVSSFRSSLSKHPSHEAEKFYKEADNFDTRGLFKEAVEKFNSAINIRPYDAGYWMCRAITYSKAGKHELAISDAQIACRLAPHKETCWGDLADIFYHAGNKEEALNAIEKALTINNNYQFGWELKNKIKRKGGCLKTIALLFLSILILIFYS